MNAAEIDAVAGTLPDPGSTMLLLVALALAPFVLGMVTSFAKLVVVGGLLRSGLGAQHVPPNSVITGIAIVLTVRIMAPVARDAAAAWEQAPTTAASGAAVNGDAVNGDAANGDAANATTEPMTAAEETEARALAALEVVSAFLAHHGEPHLAMFEELSADRSRDLAGDDEAVGGGDHGDGGHRDEATEGDPSTPDPAAVGGSLERRFAPWVRVATVEAPAFLVTELKEAFAIGFVILLPFLVIDLVVANLLLAMGMMMVSPQVFSLPLKLLLFVLIDLWGKILGGLVANYA